MCCWKFCNLRFSKVFQALFSTEGQFHDQKSIVLIVAQPMLKGTAQVVTANNVGIVIVAVAHLVGAVTNRKHQDNSPGSNCGSSKDTVFVNYQHSAS